MSNPLEEYLSALEARDAHEKAHERYINAYTKLADRTAALSAPTAAPTPAPPEPSPSPTQSTSRFRRPGTPKDRSTSGDISSAPSNLAQIRAELASTQRSRSELETKLSAATEELEAMKVTETEQKKRIAHLEKVKETLERRMKDRQDELKGKGTFVDEVQNELVALNLQLNMAEQERDKLKQENEELTRRWVEKMEALARKTNESNDAWTGRNRS